jgi:hypothetical protein
MKNKFLIVVMAGVLAAAGPLLAHHGTAAYNTKDPVTVSGTVTDFQFLNPHSIVSFDVKGEKGVEKWQGELTSPNRLVRFGWNKNSLKAGDKVTITGSRATSGANSLWITTVVSNGEELKLGAGD